MSEELNLGLVTSVITFICLLVFGYVTGDAVGKSEVIGFAGAIAGLVVWYYNEKHNSDLISGEDTICLDEIVLEDETDLINEDYYAKQDLEDEV